MAKTKAAPYLVDSLPLAAAILTAGVTLAEVDRTNPRRATFIFTDPEASSIAKQFVAGELRLEPRALFSKFDDLRTLIRKGGELAR